MAELLLGPNIGDPLVDVVPEKLSCHMKVLPVAQLPEPTWVDWDSVRRGQQHWMDLLSPSFAVLGVMLLNGFHTARFAEVLQHCGYAQDGHTALVRYRFTAFALLDWMNHPLDQSDSFARRAIYSVRCMHGMARHRSRSLFDTEKGEGIPLSQYDLAEVLLGFSAICMDLLQRELGFGIPSTTRSDMVHMWRLIGHHLGVQDEYNVCSSVERMEACLDDYRSFITQRSSHTRKSTEMLRVTAIEGFGGLALGNEFWFGAATLSLNSRWDLPAEAQSSSLEGMDQIVLNLFLLFRWGFMRRHLNTKIMGFRTLQRDDPKADRQILRMQAHVGRALDVFVWPVVARAYLLRRVIALLVLAAVMIFCTEIIKF
jgi:hypothetical protein